MIEHIVAQIHAMKNPPSKILLMAIGATAWASLSSPVIADETQTTNSFSATSIAPYVRDAFGHDPSTIIKCDDEYWIFTTGRGVRSLRSKDLANWEQGPAIFTNAPAWVATTVPENNRMHYWAPDIIHLNGRYLLYYSVSTFGKRVSAIGLAASPTLDLEDPAFGWTDHGTVVTSNNDDNFNAIDPAVFRETNGKVWMSFGSFWSGIKMVELNPQTGKRIQPDSPLFSLAHSESIEAPFIYQRDGFYYLFVNWGICCRGTNSTYHIRMGRSEKVTGPYLDRAGKNMLHGGGTLFLETTHPYYGPGHAGIFVEKGTNWFSCHYEANADAVIPSGERQRTFPIAIFPLRWTADKWPELDLKSGS